MTYPDFPHQDVPSTGELALDDRAALRRVAGLSTELADVSEVEYRQLRLERVVLVGVWTDGSAADADASLAELAALAETAGSEVLEGMVHPGLLVGKGLELTRQDDHRVLGDLDVQAVAPVGQGHPHRLGPRHPEDAPSAHQSHTGVTGTPPGGGRGSGRRPQAGPACP